MTDELRQARLAIEVLVGERDAAIAERDQCLEEVRALHEQIQRHITSTAGGGGSGLAYILVKPGEK
jgi:hypothetical protein